ncbi:hypothetical protein IW262DRAFT_883266 [Armillaria fumosa]|nr:hypothetical protein IW262DRAFT_883266 [Armillaria fumosa]
MDDNGPVPPTQLLHEIVGTVAEDSDDSDAQNIYETISFSPTDEDYIDKLAKIHAADPTVLAEQPRTLRLCDGMDVDLADDPILETIISQMRNLRVVSFTFLNAEGPWPFIDSFASPSMAQITSLELRHVTLSFHAFNSFISSPCLTELFLAGLRVVEYESAPDIEDGTDFSAPDCSLPQPQSALSCPLKELRLDIIKSSDFAIMNLIATSRYPIIAEDSLDKVTFSSDYTQYDQVPLFQRFLDCKAIKSAKMLHLGDEEGSFTEPDTTDYDPLRFDTFETVELCVGLGRDWASKEPEFQWWANSLSAVPVGSPLKKLRLIITFPIINVRALPDVTMDVWDDLDRALCGDNLELEHLAIDIATSAPLRRLDNLTVKRWFFVCLPGTHEKYFAEGTKRKNGSLNVSQRFQI